MIKTKKIYTILSIIIINLYLLKGACYAKTQRDIIKAWKLILEEIKTYTYTPPDFDPFKEIIQTLQPAPVSENITVFFKNYKLNELRLVGIVKIKNKKIAIIEDPNGKGMFLKSGDYIGKEGAIITKITECSIHIAKRYVNKKGNIILSQKEIILRLHSEEETCKEQYLH